MKIMTAGGIMALLLGGAEALAGSAPAYIADIMNQPVSWGAECVLPGGSGLAFGGSSQRPMTVAPVPGSKKAVSGRPSMRTCALRTRCRNSTTRPGRCAPV